MKALALRVARLEGKALPDRRLPTWSGSARTMGDDEAVRAAIAEHRRCTGWTGPVMLAPARMTQAEWVARYGRID